ncbi:MAG: hypothetical protein EOO89_21865 [Pedobacter sp.]|nr:MAG: hypothetical protein EOO89_21865 [Pedobacter sp.]
MKKVKLLSKAEMKKVLGGYVAPGEGGGGTGGRCVGYCCPDSGSCSGQTGQTYNYPCTTNEECQDAILAHSGTCASGSYVAALCK